MTKQQSNNIATFSRPIWQNMAFFAVFAISTIAKKPFISSLCATFATSR